MVNFEDSQVNIIYFDGQTEDNENVKLITYELMKRLINVKYNGKEYKSKEKIGKDYKNQL